MRAIILTILMLTLLAGIGLAQESGIGIGLIFDNGGGGITGKYWLGAHTAVTASLGPGVNLGYLWHATDRFQYLEDIKTPYFFGVGVGYHSSKNDAGEIESDLLLKGIIGQDYIFEKQSIDAFWELTPAINLAADAALSIFNYAIGVRYYF